MPGDVPRGSSARQARPPGPCGGLFPLLDLVTQVLRQGWQVHSDRQKVPIGRHMNVGHRSTPLSWGCACQSRHAEDALEAEYDRFSERESEEWKGARSEACSLPWLRKTRSGSAPPQGRFVGALRA